MARWSEVGLGLGLAQLVSESTIKAQPLIEQALLTLNPNVGLHFVTALSPSPTQVTFFELACLGRPYSGDGDPKPKPNPYPYPGAADPDSNPDPNPDPNPNPTQVLLTVCFIAPIVSMWIPFLGGLRLH